MSLSFDLSDPKSYYDHIKTQRSTNFRQFVDKQEKLSLQRKTFNNSKEEHSPYIKISAQETEKQMARHITHSVKLRNG